ncbi:MAG: class I SAM-dependent methyltransferase [Verrucomicrobiae bacterium]|nr:class I SAM-dependent methyltransferase [Verrucomicrobiae bacterium]
MDFKIHDAEWTDEKIARFWDFYNNYGPFEGRCFSKHAGEGIFNFCRRYIDLKGNILDYGAGKGHLIESLLELQSVCVYGFDFSPASAEAVNATHGKRDSFKGCRTMVSGVTGTNYTQFESGFFDIVFLVEVIEHLTDKYLGSTLEEIRRTLRDNGIVVITTPNNEDLRQQHVICPDCGSVFHRVQHVRSFDAERLESLLRYHKFNALFCGNTNFGHYNVLSPTNLLKQFRNALVRKQTHPHLIYIGAKSPVGPIGTHSQGMSQESVS